MLLAIGLTILIAGSFIACAFVADARADEADEERWQQLANRGDPHPSNVLNAPVHTSLYANEGRHDHA